LTDRLLVVGGDAAGMSAAAQARRRRSVDELEIVAFERGDYTSYSACGLPYLVAEQIDDPQELVARTPAAHREHGIDVRLRHEVLAIDVANHEVTVRDLDRRSEQREPFDQLVIAVGASPVRPDLPGVDADGVFGLQTLADGIVLRRHLNSRHREHGRAVVVGAGYIGLEMAEAMHNRGMDVTVVESAPQPMRTLDPDIGALVAVGMRELEIDFRPSTDVEGFATGTDGHVEAVETSNGSIPTDVVVLGIGVRPNVEMARDAGIEIGHAGGIATDARQQTSVDGIWAAGDCTQTRHRVTEKQVLIALGTHANKQGRIAGTNATGGSATFPGVVGTAVTKVCEYEVGRTGLNESEAGDAGFDYVTATIESTTRAGYYPETQPITVKVLAERGSGRLLGAQIIGKEGAAKRIDVLATAIWAEMPVGEVALLDLGYSPPFSPVWDPTVVAARKVAGLV
jgi:NADPH-dependent 2,4-dienoyl-CoA reductase/sulfur reductase-like enzyme